MVTGAALLCPRPDDSYRPLTGQRVPLSALEVLILGTGSAGLDDWPGQS